MSASNWTTCPRCKRRRAAAIAEKLAALTASYGSDSVEEYQRRHAELVELEQQQLPSNLREDYEIYGADKGEVVVEYGCYCKDCGLEVGFKHTVPIGGQE